MIVFLIFFCLAIVNAAEVRVSELTSARLLLRQADQGLGVEAVLSLTHKPGWHTYFANPGDSGMPTSASFSADGAPLVFSTVWPLPHRIEVGPLVNYGYDDRVDILYEIYDLRVIPREVTGSFDWLVCKEECIPESVVITSSVALRGTSAYADMHTIYSKLRASLPDNWSDAEATLNEQYLTISGRSFSKATDAYFFPFAEGVVNPQAQQKATYAEGRLHLTLSVNSTSLTSVSGLLRVGDQGKIIQTQVRPAAIPNSEEAMGLWLALFGAFIGGMILNLMPCVLPILFLKAWSLAKATESHSQAVREGLIYSLGVVSSFVLIAAVLVGLKASGEQLGWGFQLQVPGFVLAMACLMFLIGLNLMGWFELPVLFGEKGHEVAQSDSGYASFMTGVLATFVATPCSGPFMATAIGFALGQSVPVTLLVFACLGAGMAAPYLAICSSSLARGCLPKPGAWMETFRQSLCLPMFATTIWLLWVLGLQTSSDAIIQSLGLMLLIFAAAWLLRQVGNFRKMFRHALGVFITISILFLAREIVSQESKEKASLPWETFSLRALEIYRAAGRPVFVDVTAAWCISCMVNEKVVLETEATRELFANSNVVLMKADWTKKDREITSFLQSFAREGVPLYVFYGKNTEPVVLPQVLTFGIVKEAVASELKGL